MLHPDQVVSHPLGPHNNHEQGSRKSERAKTPSKAKKESTPGERSVGVGGKCGSRQGVVGRSDRPRARDTSDRRRIRGRKESGTSKAELRQARARSRNSGRRWGAAHPRAASLSASAFPWANGSSEFVRAGIQKMEIELSRFT